MGLLVSKNTDKCLGGPEFRREGPCEEICEFFQLMEEKVDKQVVKEDPPKKKGRVGILCGGGPAPGFNSVISSATMYADDRGYDVFGFYDGYQYLMMDELPKEKKHFKKLSLKKTSRICFKGGSIIRSSRANPKNEENGLANCVRNLQKLGIEYLITIGGDDTLTSAVRIYKESKKSIRIVHVPKTIDNDLPIPPDCDTFGFNTAREFGATVVHGLMTDAQTNYRFFLAECMGRKAGHLALGIGKGSSAHLTLIPEQFLNEKGGKVTMDAICQVIYGCVIKRYSQGRPHGVIILAEGLMEFMEEDELVELFGKENIQHDSHGHVRLELLNLGTKVKEKMETKLKEMGGVLAKTRFTAKKIGYEIRARPPNCADRIYTRDLGNAAIKHALDKSKRAGCMITIQRNLAKPMYMEDLPKEKDGHIAVRRLDVSSQYYKVADDYMVRLKKEDFYGKRRSDDKDLKLVYTEIGNFKSVEAFLEEFKEIKEKEDQEK